MQRSTGIPGDNKEWTNDDTWKENETRREVKQKLNRGTCMAKKRKPQRVYKGKRKEVKQKVKRDKKKWMEHLAQQAEEAATAHNTRELYDLTKRMARKEQKQLNASEG